MKNGQLINIHSTIYSAGHRNLFVGGFFAFEAHDLQVSMHELSSHTHTDSSTICFSIRRFVDYYYYGDN